MNTLKLSLSVAFIALSSLAFAQQGEMNKDAAIKQIDNAIEADGEMGKLGLRGGDIAFYNFKTGQEELVKDVFSMTDEKAHEFIPRDSEGEIDGDLIAFYNTYRADGSIPYEALFATWVELFKVIKNTNKE